MKLTLKNNVLFAMLVFLAQGYTPIARCMINHPSFKVKNYSIPTIFSALNKENKVHEIKVKNYSVPTIFTEENKVHEIIKTMLNAKKIAYPEFTIEKSKEELENFSVNLNKKNNKPTLLIKSNIIDLMIKKNNCHMYTPEILLKIGFIKNRENNQYESKIAHGINLSALALFCCNVIYTKSILKFNAYSLLLGATTVYYHNYIFKKNQKDIDTFVINHATYLELNRFKNYLTNTDGSYMRFIEKRIESIENKMESKNSSQEVKELAKFENKVNSLTKEAKKNLPFKSDKEIDRTLKLAFLSSNIAVLDIFETFRKQSTTAVTAAEGASNAHTANEINQLLNTQENVAQLNANESKLNKNLRLLEKSYSQYTDNNLMSID